MREELMMARAGLCGVLVATTLPLAAGESAAQAAGILNSACTPGQKVIVKDFADPPADKVGRGQDMAAFVSAKDGGGAYGEYMMLVWAVDSGKAGGGFSFYNWNDPGSFGAPVLKARKPASQLREAHSTPTTNMFNNGWRTWTLQATTGFSVYDIADIGSPTLKKDYLIKGASAGGKGSKAVCKGSCATSYDATSYDYSLGAVWYLGLQAPYLFVGQTDNGVNIYKFTDPRDPSKISWVKRLDKSLLGDRANNVWVMGNLLVTGSSNDTYALNMIDISDPENPVIKQHYDLKSSPKMLNAYSWTLNGTNLYETLRVKPGLNKNGLAVWPINPSSLALGTPKQYQGTCSTGGYTAIQDRYAFVGLSSCFQKINLGTLKAVSPANPPWSIGISGVDNDFPTPFGSAFFLGNDHNAEPGSAILCHQKGRDTTGPVANGQMPPNGASGIKTTTGVGVSFSDNLKQWTINSQTLPVRRKGGATVDGYYSYQLNMVNFRPAQAFDRGTTYEVRVTAGVKDLAGNGAGGPVRSFATASGAQASFEDPGNAAAWSMRADLQDGASAYGGDRPATITAVPDALKARTWISPAAASRGTAEDRALVRLDLDAAGDVYVCADDRDAVRRPGWLADWTPSGDTLALQDEGSTWTMGCYRRNVPAGSLVLNGAGEAASSQYLVVIGPSEPAASRMAVATRQ